MRRRCFLISGAVLIAICQTQSFADEVDLRYTWMLPKTVIDATIVYTFQDCSGDGAKIKITPTLISRTLPDLRVGQKSLKPADLDSFSQDKGISLQTFNGSRILNSIGSQPTSQTGQIAGNILGGVAKLVGIALGVAPVAPADAPVVPPPTCATGDDSASGITKQIEDLKTKIKAYQKELSGGVDEATQKKDNAALQAAQGLIMTLQDQLTITVKTTIDPGVNPIMVDTDNDATSIQKQDKNGSVQNSGLVSTICPSRKQLQKANWFSNLDQMFANGRNACVAVPSLEISVYLDFRSAHSTMYDDPTYAGPYRQTDVEQDQQYRDVAYIPVLVWRGEKKSGDLSKDKDGVVTGPMPLATPQIMPFGQFGVAQNLPLSVKTFRSINWGVTFLEDGEITNATFTSKAWGINATGLFGSAVSAANSVVTEERNATSPNTQATTLQSQADLIYQTQRLQLCQTNPLNCPSK